MNIAPWLKEIARGKDGARSLGRSDACALMGAVLDDQVAPVQLGAFLIAMRIKGESVEELAGYLDATQARCLQIPSTQPVVVLPSYNGSRRLPNFTPLLALLLARLGVRALVHGPLTDPVRVTSASIFQALGIAPSGSVEAAQRAWSSGLPVFMDIAVLCPALSRLLDLRWTIGLRNSGHAVAKLIDPCGGASTLRVANYTHPEYAVSMHGLLSHIQAHALLLRGTEGEPVADARRLPKMEVLIAGEPRTDLSLAALDGVLASLPEFPSTTDARTTSDHLKALLSGAAAVPQPIEAQARCLSAICDELARRRIGNAGAAE